MPLDRRPAEGRRVAIVGGGWAGLAAAVHATEAGHRVTLFEMAQQLGGRARRVPGPEGLGLDNGQHILIGAYTETLALMRHVGADPDRLLRRLPLALAGADGRGLRLPTGAPMPAFVRAVLARPGWSLAARLGLLIEAARWRRAGFECATHLTVAQLTGALATSVRRDLIEPLCVAALNTPADRASARVFLRVLRDALFSGPGSADLLLPRADLSALLPEPAAAWLASAGADIRLGARVLRLDRAHAAWQVDGEAFDGVVLACSAVEAARLAAAAAPDWAAVAAGFEYEPIITVVLRSRGTRLPQPMTLLDADSDAPAQFAFDLGAIDGGGPREGLFAFVVSGARSWSERGLDATAAATLRQAAQAFPARTWAEPPVVLRCHAERRATFLCTPGQRRPRIEIAERLTAAGDHVAGPYPATLEGAVRAGAAAVAALGLSAARASTRPAADDPRCRAAAPATASQLAQRALPTARR